MDNAFLQLNSYHAVFALCLFVIFSEPAVKNDLLLDHATVCPNCSTHIAGQFCQGCGQAAHLHVPSAREFLH